MWWYKRKGSSGFSSSFTAEEVTRGIDGSGLTAIVTGIMGTPFKLSEDNVKLQFATNHLGPFLLTNVLLDNMKKTYQQTKKDGRIVNVSSDAHRYTYREGIRFDRINDRKGYNNFLAYCQSKIANILHADELSRRLKEDGVEITANSVHPGVITSNIFRRRGCCIGLASRLDKYMFKTVQQGASTTCHVAFHQQVKGISGAYFRNNNIAKASSKAKELDLPRRLWDFTMNLVEQNADDSLKAKSATKEA